MARQTVGTINFRAGQEKHNRDAIDAKLSIVDANFVELDSLFNTASANVAAVSTGTDATYETAINAILACLKDKGLMVADS